MADLQPVDYDPFASGSGPERGSMTQEQLQTKLDSIFGKGKAKITGGYRSPQREDQLRAQGAETVAPGHTSEHSIGTPDAPGAFDVVVDGMSPTEAAVYMQKAGLGVKRLFPEGTSGTQGAHLHVEPYLTDAPPVRDAGEQPNPQVQAAQPNPEQPQSNTQPQGQSLQTVDYDPFAPPSQTDVAGMYRTAAQAEANAASADAELARQRVSPLTRLRQATEPVTNIGGDIAARAQAGDAQMRAAVQAEDQRRQRIAANQQAIFYGKSTGSPLQDTERLVKTALDMTSDSLSLNPNALNYMSGAADLLTSPVMGAIDSLFGRPTQNAILAAGGPKVRAQMVSDLAALAIPFGGEVRAEQEIARLAQQTGRPAYSIARELVQRREAAAAASQEIAAAGKARKATPEDPLRAQAAARLRQQGVRPTPGMEGGGEMERHERVDRMKSPISGEKVRRDRNQASYDFQRATYNQVLAPLGEQYPKEGPVGQDGYAYVQGKFQQAYQQTLPQARIDPNNAELTKALAQIRAKYNGLPRDQIRQLSQTIQTEVKNRFSAQGMSGIDFKAAEEILGREGANYRSSKDPDQRKLGQAYNEVVTALQHAIETDSPPQIGARLRQINQGYARFVRLRTAVTRRATPDGVFTPNDLLQAVKRHDTSVGKDAFAKGQALMQPLAQDAVTVLGAGHRPITTPVARGMGHAFGAAVGTGLGALAGSKIGHPWVGAGVGEFLGARAGKVLDPMLTNRAHNIIRALDRAKVAEKLRQTGVRNALRRYVQPILPAGGAAALMSPQPASQ